MGSFTCRSCTRSLPPFRRYEDSDWCDECVDLALHDQEIEDSAYVLPEVFSL